MSDPILIHAVLMITAWLVLLPMGAAIARFGKVTPRQDWPRVLDSQLWWWLHRIVQYAGVGCALAGFAVVYRATGSLDLGLLHVAAGLVLLCLALLQIVSTWFRGSRGGPDEPGADPQRPQSWRGDHYDMTPRRRAFEAWHKGAGWLSILIGPLTILLGLRLDGWPRELCIAALVLTLLQLAAFATLTSRGRRIGTYQAIWGPDSAHPGNRAKSGGSI